VPPRNITPVDNSVYVERPYATPAEIGATLKRAADAEGLEGDAGRGACAAGRQGVDIFLTHKDAIAEEITRQMGRPISQSPGEMRGFEERAAT